MTKEDVEIDESITLVKHGLSQIPREGLLKLQQRLSEGKPVLMDGRVYCYYRGYG